MNKNSALTTRAHLVAASRRHFVAIAAAAIVSTGALTATVAALDSGNANPAGAIGSISHDVPGTTSGSSGSSGSTSSSSGISGSNSSQGSPDGGSNAS